MRFNLISDLMPASSVDLQDRGLHYGDGVFETLLLHNGEIKYWNEHFDRLSFSADKLHIACPKKSWIEQQLKLYIELNRTLILKIILNRGNGGRGLLLPEDGTPNIVMLKYDYKLPDIYQPVNTIISEIALPLNSNLAGLKHTNRLDYILAIERLKKHPAANEAILCDTDGFLVEGLVNNLFFIRRNEVYTPALDQSGVDGIMRNLIIKKLNEDAIEVHINRFTVQKLIDSDECFMCNSVQGIRPITRIDNTHFELGPITQKLQHSFSGHTVN